MSEQKDILWRSVMIDAISTERLGPLHPALQRKVSDAATHAAVFGVYFRVAQGLRTYEEQDKIFFQCHTPDGKRDSRPWTTNARGGWSPHNHGMAVDVFPFKNGYSGDLEMQNPKAANFVIMVKCMKAQGLAWGGDWIHEKDYPHFQLAGVPTTPTDADRAAFAHGGLEAVWALYPDLK